MLVIAEPGSPGDELATRLARDGAAVVRVRSGAGFEWPSAGEVVVNPAERDDWTWLLDAVAEAGTPPRRVVDTTGLDGGDASTTLLRLIALGQALAGRAEPVELVVLTAGAQDVHGDDLTRPELAVVAGPCRTLPLESPVVGCRHVDVLGANPDVIAAELAASDAETVVALRGRKRWVPATQQVRLDGGDPAARPAPRGDLAGHRRVGRRRAGRRRAPGGPVGRASRARRSHGRPGHRCRRAAADLRRCRRHRSRGAPGIARDRRGALRPARRDRACRGGARPRAAGADRRGPGGTGDRAEDHRHARPRRRVRRSPARRVRALLVGLRDHRRGRAGRLRRGQRLPRRVRGEPGAADRADRLDRVGRLAGHRDVRRVARRDAPAPAPVAAHRRDEPGGAVVLAGELRADMWALAEHRLDGVAVLPGTAMVELLLAGRAAVAGAGLAALRNVRFVAPLAVADAGTVRVEVRAEPGAAGEWALTLSTPDTGLRHAVAMSATPRPAGTSHDVPAGEIGPARAPFDEPWLEFGPRWSSVCGVAGTPDAQVVELQAPDVVAAELAAFTVHPALLDAALAAGSSGDRDGRFLPSGYERIEVHGLLPARARAVLRPGSATADERRVDAVLVDTDGHEVVRVDGFTLQRTPERTSAPAPPPAHGAGIRPAEGAEALRRVLAAGIGPHVLVSAVPLDEMRAGLRPEPSVDGQQDVDVAPAERDGLEPYVAPRTELERQLAALWSEAIGVGEIGVDDDYFGLGGNSMAGVHLLWRVGETLGVTLTMRDLFDAPTVAGMAAAVEQARAAGTEAPAVSPITILPR